MSLISSKNQVTLPVEVLRAAGLGPGDDVRVQAVGAGRLEIVRSEDSVTEFAGVFDGTVYPPGYLDDLPARVAVVVFDADVLIGYLNADDAHHAAAVERMTNALAPDTVRRISAVNYSELLVGPLRAAGRAGGEIVDAMLTRFAIETVAVDASLAREAAALRATENLGLPDAFAVATALQASARGEDARLESFDERVVKAYTRLL